MANRAHDWFEQGQRDLHLARHARTAGSHEWACFAAQQGAEKAMKAVIFAHGGVPWGHSVHALARSLPQGIDVSAAVLDASRDLDKLYIPTRYPNGFDSGKPADYFSEKDATDAIGQAESILDFCQRHLPEP